MKKYLFAVFFVFSSSVSAGLFNEKMCGVSKINADSGACKKGDVIFGGSSPRRVAMICDMDKQISISEKGFVCYYVGYKRELRK